MKNALISPEEKVYKYDGSLLGERVATIMDLPFEVASPLFWIECNDDVVADQFYYDTETQNIIVVPVKPKITVGDVPNVIA
jgi:hypothetical protein